MHKRLCSHHACEVIDLLVKHSCNASNASNAQQPSTGPCDSLTDRSRSDEGCARSARCANLGVTRCDVGQTGAASSAFVTAGSCFLPLESASSPCINLRHAAHSSGSLVHRNTAHAACVNCFHRLWWFVAALAVTHVNARNNSAKGCCRPNIWRQHSECKSAHSCLHSPTAVWVCRMLGDP